MDDRVDNSMKMNEKFLAYFYGHGQITVKITSKIIEICDTTARQLLSGLVDKNVLSWHKNSKRDPKQYYKFNSQ